jgi:hypothetical protein
VSKPNDKKHTMTRRAPLLTVLLVSLTVLLVASQTAPEEAPRPNALVAKQELLKLTGNKEAEPSKVVHILWLDSPR